LYYQINQPDTTIDYPTLSSLSSKIRYDFGGGKVNYSCPILSITAIESRLVFEKLITSKKDRSLAM
jgi:hypothetical protein